MKTFAWERCPDTVWGFHGPADHVGRCPWCGRRFEPAMRAPARTHEPTDLTDAYGLFYDPDHDARTRDQIRDRYRLGQDV